MDASPIELKPDFTRSPSDQPVFDRIIREARPADGFSGFETPAGSEEGRDSFLLGAFALLMQRLSGQATGSISYSDPSGMLRIVSVDAADMTDFLAWNRKVLDSISAVGSPVPTVPPIHFSLASGSSSGDFCLQIAGGALTAYYRSDLFSRDRMQIILDQFCVLCGQIAADKSRHPCDYSLVTGGGRLLPDPAERIDEPEFLPVSDLIVGNADANPGHPAVEQGEQIWTYQQLAETSLRVAGCLVDGGLQPGECVALTGPRSFGFIASMLGILRAGGVLLNIDTALPGPRQQLMAEEAHAGFLVTVGSESPLSPLFESRRILGITPDGSIPSGCEHSGEQRRSLPPVSPHQPAYIFFTSGSTGTPKAVHGRHSGLSHFLHWQRTRFSIGDTDRASQLTAASFDVILRDVFMVLSAGGTLCIPGEFDVLDPLRIIRWLETKRITVLHVVPSLARLWLRSLPAGQQPLPLKHVFFAGEPLSDLLCREWRSKLAPDAQLVNLYGPTETTLAKCFFPLGEEIEPGIQSIGHPLPNTQVLILNQRRNLCGIHEPGEIAIRTPFRSLGYFNNPEATAKVFILNPFREGPDDLVYLTGDGGCYRTDGRLTIFGRLDNQVKIRGIRVEPGEIEALIAKHPQVRDAAVVARMDPAGEKALVAYIVPNCPETAAHGDLVSGLREYLRELVMTAMVPSAFVLLEKLPLNANGKINRQALPEPDLGAFSSAHYVPPSSQMESQLLQAWEKVLNREHVGVEDDFFNIGGHSLLVVQLIEEIRATVGFNVTIPQFFRCRTIRKLADELVLNDPALSKTAVFPLQPHGDGPGLFCIVGLQIYQELADQFAPDIPVYGLFLPYEGELLEKSGDDQPRCRSIQELAAGYIEAMRDRQPQGPYLLCGVSFGGVVAYEMASQLEHQGEQVGIVCLLDTILPSAVKRNWGKWLVHKVSEAFKNVGRRKSKGGQESSPSTSAAHFPVKPRVAENPALMALAEKRQAFYRNAELAYQVPVSRYPVVLARAMQRTKPSYDLQDGSFGWGASARNLTLIDVPGDHLGMLEADNAVVLASRLRPYVSKGRMVKD